MTILPTFFALVGAIVFIATLVHSSDDEQFVSLNCTSDQTECALGCCPYSDGVCCSDGFECCQHGQTCIPVIGICLGINNEKKKPVLVNSRATPVYNLTTSCPSGTTTCGPDRCCDMPHAVCCSDGEHCCPRGYRCDTARKRCLKNSDYVNSVFDFPSTTDMRSFEPLKTSSKDPYKSCPGSTRQCPSYMSCCLNDDGAWGCCPNPASSQYKKKGVNMCCMTMHGYVCCPPWSHACTYIGCM